MSIIVDEKKAHELAKRVRLNTEAVPLRWWQYGVQTEADAISLMLATGKVLLAKGVSVEDAAAAYALEKLKRYPDWYERVKRCEDQAIRAWRRMDEEEEEKGE